MKKVGIVTMFGLCNYGNRLQNYAMQMILEKLGVEPLSIIVKEYQYTGFNRMKIIPKKVLTKILPIEKCIKHIRFLNFYEFQKNIKSFIISKKNLELLDDTFDFCITGSDQVWNPDVANDFYFLKFVKPAKRIAVSPSIGVEELSADKKYIFENAVNEFKALSVREKEGQELLQRLTDKEVYHLIDPVLMIDKPEWDKVKSKINLPQEKYLLINMLGEVDSGRMPKIKEISAEHGLKIIDINDEKNIFFSSGPSEYISLIENADLVCTDSFHTIIFSMIYKKNFIAFQRVESNEDTNSRIQTLLDVFENEDRWAELVGENIFETNYSKFDEILSKKKEEFVNYVSNALEL